MDFFNIFTEILTKQNKNIHVAHYEESLLKLRPVGKVTFLGLSLVVKYSEENPDVILTCDESGQIYLINTIEIAKYPTQPGSDIKEIKYTSIFKIRAGPPTISKSFFFV